MSRDTRFPVVLLWHMHQPNYRDALSGQYLLPWTYLHAIKDYVDMAAHLEANPLARAVVNFTPVLIEQLQELAVATAAHLRDGRALPDPVLAVLSPQPLPVEAAPRLALIRALLRANRGRMIDRYPPFASLASLAASFLTPAHAGYASDSFVRDLGVWYHLAWLGETVKRTDPRVAALIARERDFGPGHCRSLLELIAELLAELLPRYRRLRERGQIELAVSPYGHPILPLLLDFNAAREARPESPLPRAAGYPGGAERARWHMREGLDVFERAFGCRPSGCWPSEGAISADALDLVDASGFQWAATSANVLRGCVGAVEPDRPYRRPNRALQCFFRHDELSDLIGFTYSTWHGDDAVKNFVAHLEQVAQSAPGHEASPVTRLALIAMDGENAWDRYPFNGYYFLQGLYAALADHPRLRLTTLGELVAASPEAALLPQVVAGSWVHGTLATWMGDPDKNAAWDLLVEAKLAVDAVLAGGMHDAAARARIERQLAQCESSDWFWWFGDYNPADSVRDFDALYRHQLTSLYQLIGVAPPEALSRPISVGRGDPEGGGVMRRAHE